MRRACLHDLNCLRRTVTAKLRNTSGASIIIALVFFLICAIIGSVVLTAASVQAKAAQTHTTAQRQEYAVSSAASVWADQLGKASVTWTYASNDQTKTPSASVTGSDFAKALWDKYASDAWSVYKSRTGDPLVIGRDDPFTFKSGDVSGFQTMYGVVSIDSDFNVSVELSTDSHMAPDTEYNLTVFLQCIPTYDFQGALKKIEWDAPVITKTEALAKDGGK